MPIYRYFSKIEFFNLHFMFFYNIILLFGFAPNPIYKMGKVNMILTLYLLAKFDKKPRAVVFTTLIFYQAYLKNILL